MSKPRLLDLFCGAGGAGMGYHRTGFEVVGVDLHPMPRYPFEFHQGDALEYMAAHGHEFDAIHASPPCQSYSATKTLTTKVYPRLVEPVREMLIKFGKPWVIENVPGAPLKNPTLLCGAMFDLGTYRHRLFETSFELPFLMHPGHGASSDKLSGPTGKRSKQMAVVVGHYCYAGAFPKWQAAMGIDWMKCDELTEAIPPAYTEYIGRFLLLAAGGRF